MSDSHLRMQLTNALTVRQAHQSLADAVKDFPAAHYNTRPPHTPYTFWHLLEHIRIAQADILDYIENPQYRYLQFPDDYWPAADAVADPADWGRSLDAFHADLNALARIAADPARDLHAQIPHGQPGHTILREILIVAAHNAYHTGEFGILRGTMGLW